MRRGIDPKFILNLNTPEQYESACLRLRRRRRRTGSGRVTMKKKKKLVIPHEHGGWAMVSVPFLTGMMVATPQWIHLTLFTGWLLLYLASYPFCKP